MGNIMGAGWERDERELGLERDEAREPGGRERRRCVARVCASVFRRREGALWKSSCNWSGDCVMSQLI